MEIARVPFQIHHRKGSLQDVFQDHLHCKGILQISLLKEVLYLHVRRLLDSFNESSLDMVVENMPSVIPILPRHHRKWPFKKTQTHTRTHAHTHTRASSRLPSLTKMLSAKLNRITGSHLLDPADPLGKANGDLLLGELVTAKMLIYIYIHVSKTCVLYIALPI